MFAQLGFEIPRKCMCEWIGATVDEYLKPLHRQLQRDSLSDDYLQGDETTIKVQDGVVEGKCHQGYLWGMVSPKKEVVVFEYVESRAREVAENIFDGLRAALQAGLYARYNTVYLPEKVVRIACLAHVRRMSVEAGKSCAKESDAEACRASHRLVKVLILGLERPE
jgi:hypothetical protein